MVANPIFLYEIGYYDPATLSTGTLRFSTGGYVTRPSDTPANTEYKDAVIKAGGFASYMFGNNRTVGNSSAGFGEFVVGNDRSYDLYLDYGFDLRSFRVLSIQGKRASYSTAVEVFTGIIDSVEFTWSEIRFVIRSPLAYLNEQAISVTYAGTNGASLTATEGDAEITGQLKPFVYGKVFNIRPKLANRVSLLYVVNYNASGNPAAVHSIPAVRDGESELTFHSNFATIADLVAHSAAAGQYTTCVAQGAFCIHTEPTFEITCDVIEKLSSADMTPAQLASRLIADRSPALSLSNFDSPSITALDAKISAVEGIYVDDSATLLACADQLLNPLGCSLIGKLDGNLAFTRLEAPSTSVSTLKEDEIFKDGFELQTGSDTGAGVPYWKFIVNHTKNYTIHGENDAAGIAVDNGRVEFSKLEYRAKTVEVSALKTAYLAAGVYEAFTLLTAEADAATEATRQSVLRGSFRKLWNVPTSRNTIIELGSTITLQVDAFGMENGWDGVIIGYEYDFGTNRVTYQVFG